MTVTEFLLARIAEDEAVARAATPGPWEWEGDYPHGNCPHDTEWTDHGPDLVTVAKKPPYQDGSVSPELYVLTASGYDSSSLDVTDADAAHIARHDPARVLAECAAKRAIIELAGEVHDKITWEWGGCQSWKEDGWEEGNEGTEIIRTLAAIYKDHPDYQSNWLV